MKKLFAIVLVVMLALGTVSALADKELNWTEEYAAQAEQIGGEFVAIEELGLVMWVPADMPAQEVSEGYQAIGYFAIYGNDSAAVALQYVESDGADLMEKVNNIEGAANAEAMTVNGLPCVNFDMPDYDGTCVAFATEKGNVFVITFTPISSEDFKANAQVIMASLQAAE